MVVERADDREDRQVDALGLEAGTAQRVEQLIDALTLGDDDDHAQALALGSVDESDLVKVHDGALQRHRDALLSLHHQRGPDVLVVERRQIDDTQDGPRRGQADADALGELVLGEETLELAGEAVGVGDQAVAHETGRQRPGGDALGDDLAALETSLRGDRLGRADLQSGDGGGPARRRHLQRRLAHAQGGQARHRQLLVQDAHSPTPWR